MKAVTMALATMLAMPVVAPGPAVALGGSVTFTNLSGDPATGIDYARTRSSRDSEYLQFFDPETGLPRTDLPLLEAGLAPTKSRGAPGVCLLDYDGDGDEDIYVTNGPGSANSLFVNQLHETGSLTFVDQATAAGVGAVEQDSSGCAYGDVDNDGDKDLYVLSTGDDNILFENLGDGTFVDISAASGTGGEGRFATSASLCDVDGDGLLDIVVGNTFDMINSLPIFAVPTALNEHNQLFLNQGGNVFSDVSDASGLQDLAGMVMQVEGGEVEPIPGQPAGISWSVSCVDYDLDGDMDIFVGDDQAGVPAIGDPPSPVGATNSDRGLLHIFRNDGSGQFTDVNDLIDTEQLPGSWMGSSFGDYNADGVMDFFGSNFGDANLALGINVTEFGIQPSRWFFGDGDGGFVDSLLLGGGQIPGMITTPFGWGTSSVDYDNDGDTDIIFVGDIAAGPVVTSSNPVAIWDNDGSGNFSANLSALDPEDADFHKRSMEHGMAVGDLDGDGFVDFVTVSNFFIPAEFRDPLPPPVNVPLLLPNPFDFGGPYDPATEFMPVFAPNFDDDGVPTGTFNFIPALLDLPDGVLNVERNNAENGNHWLQVEVRGSIGVVAEGAVNRDGIGAVVQCTPRQGQTAMQPVLGGSGYAQQDSLILNFGLGDARRATLDVLWPGGVRNRLHHVRHDRRLLLPEIPCSIDSPLPLVPYLSCVSSSLDALEAADVIDGNQGLRLFLSALLGYFEER